MPLKLPIPGRWMPLKATIYVGAGVILLLIGSCVIGRLDWWLGQPVLPSIPRPPVAPMQPVTLPPTERIKEAPKVTEERKVTRPVLTPKQEARVEREYHLDLGMLDLLNETKVPPLPDGGRAAVTVGPSGDTAVIVIPNPPPLFQLGGPIEVGAGVLLNKYGQGYKLYASKDLMRTGHIRYKVQGDLEVAGGHQDFSVSVLAYYRSR